MTKVINLYGGPGVGKSSVAAYLYYLLKKYNRNVELIQEYVKEWAWENRPVKSFDQIYFFAKQVRKETMLFDKVEYIITDSPVLLSLCYIRRCCDKEIAEGLEHTAKAFYSVAAKYNTEHIHIFINRTGEYNPVGRFHSEAESIQLDNEIANLLKEFKFDYLETSYQEDELNDLCALILS